MKQDQTIKQRPANSTYKKVAVQCSADTFVVIKVWFSASTFVVKIATFAKPKTVITLPQPFVVAAQPIGHNSSHNFPHLRPGPLPGPPAP